MELRRTLKRARKEKRITQAQLAEAIGVTPATIVNWEKGKTQITVDKLHQLCAALGMEAEIVVKDNMTVTH